MNKLVTLVFLMLAYDATADVIGFSVGAHYWQYDMDGQVQSPLAENGYVGIDFADNSDVNFYVGFEHPVPFLPNVKIQQNTIQSSGYIPVSDPGFMDGMVVNVLGDVDLSHTDVMLYYEILDNWVNLDLGLSAKYFDGYTRFHYEDRVNDESDFDDWIPMLYAKAQFDLPLTGLSAAATVEALSFDSNKVTDVDLALKYQNKLGLGVDIGYRTVDVDLKNINSFKTDLKADGFYLGGHFEF
jgi:outer membrane protein